MRPQPPKKLQKPPKKLYTHKKKAPAKQQDTTSVEEIVKTESKQPIEKPAPETHPSEEKTFPYETTVVVSLAVLRKNITPGTAEMLKPVATLKQGDKVTVTAVSGEYAQLKNGLWVALDCLT